MGGIQTGRIQGGTHGETPCPGVSGVDGAANFPTEVGVKLCMFQVEFVPTEEVELVYSEAKFPRDVCPMEWGRFEFLWGFFGFSSTGVRHGIVFKHLRE